MASFCDVVAVDDVCVVGILDGLVECSWHQKVVHVERDEPRSFDFFDPSVPGCRYTFVVLVLDKLGRKLFHDLWKVVC